MTITRKQIYRRNHHYMTTQERNSTIFNQKRISPSINPPQNRRKKIKFNKQGSIQNYNQSYRAQQKKHIQKRENQGKSKKRSIMQGRLKTHKFKKRKINQKGFKQKSIKRKPKIYGFKQNKLNQKKSNKRRISHRKPNNSGFKQGKHRSNTCIKNKDSVFKPIGSNLTKDDFKCIICFELPNLSDGRGVVLCPTCHYPAHVDEFKQWTRSSILCSRCEATIPYNYLNNPKVISASNYIKMIERFVKS